MMQRKRIIFLYEDSCLIDDHHSVKRQGKKNFMLKEDRGTKVNMQLVIKEEIRVFSCRVDGRCNIYSGKCIPA
jgi:hypothetical protein